MLMSSDIPIEYNFVEVHDEEVIERENHLRKLLCRAVIRHMNEHKNLN